MCKTDDRCDQFKDDPLLPALLSGKEDDYFSLGLVVNWPTKSEETTTESPESSFNAHNYETFLSAVTKECFQGHSDFLFRMPFHSLHITVATLFAAHRTSELPSAKHRIPEGATGTKGPMLAPNNDTECSSCVDAERWRTAFVKEWEKILIVASSSADWPKNPLQLELASAQIGNRAGIFLWKERTGGLEKMRKCLARVVRKESSSQTMNLEKHLRIPDIIHTTFLRYFGCRGIAMDNGNPLHPSRANSILIERIIPCHPLFSPLKKERISGSIAMNEVDTNKITDEGNERTIVVADSASFVNCKIYLQSDRMEKDHEIYLTLPVK